tara:strand:- start:346 stop:1347 length:1002 start_codon:yes stop_codon:yes gene_type:complete
MGVKFTNNAYTTLASTISASATSFDLASAATFPTLAAGDWTYVSLTDEVVKVTAISGVTCTCEAVSGGHSAGIAVELRMTAELLNDFAEDLGSGYKGGDIASASPTVIDTDGDYFNVTGTTGFSAFTVAANRHFFLQFAGALTMTHHATNLDLPGEDDILTAAGDVAEFFSTGANTVQCLNYTKADGTAVVGSLEDESVDSDHYVDGSIDNVHIVEMAGNKLTGTVTAKGDGASAVGKLLVNCESNLHGITIQSPVHSSAATYTLTLPVDDGDVDEVLKTNGSGVLDWVNILTAIENGVDSVHYVDGSIDGEHLTAVMNPALTTTGKALVMGF